MRFVAFLKRHDRRMVEIKEISTIADFRMMHLDFDQKKY